MKMRIISLILVLVVSLNLAKSDDIFLGEKHEPGFVKLNATDDMFYWLFKSRDNVDEDPLVVWLTGGPGCSSEVAIFTENGPFSVKDDLSLLKNNYSWNSKANVLYVDQPLGTGFSRAVEKDYTQSEADVAKDFRLFLLGFMAKHPELAGRELFITGESYAGHYIPAISAYLHKQADPAINLVGFAIGNGWTSPYQQYPAYNQFSYENNLIGAVQYNLLKAGFKGCQVLIETGSYSTAMSMCQSLVGSIMGNPPAFNVYDIRRKCDFPPLCYDFSNVDKFLARPDVIQALGVQGRKFQDCSDKVQEKLMGDWMNDLTVNVAYLLESGVKGLVYSGDQDFICNWRGGEAWTHAMPWTGQQAFNNATYADWMLDGKSVGQLKQADSLVFLRVYGAGHMVPMDQPQVALAMVDKFFRGWAQQSKALSQLS